MKGHLREFTAALLALQLSGCLAIHTRRETTAPQEGGVAVVVYADDGARRAGKPGPEGVFAELEFKDSGGWRPVFRSLASRWSLRLPPGTYRLAFPARINEAGDVTRLARKAKKFAVHPGEMVQVETVLQHVPVAMVVVGVVVVAVVAVALSKWLKDQDLPEPPWPSPEVADLAFYLTLDVLTEPGWAQGDRAAPVVTSHFPAQNASLLQGRVRVVWVFSEPLAPTSLDSSKIQVLGERSGLLSGVASYDDSRWWVMWESQEQIQNERIHATLAAGAVEDLAGNELERPASVSFWVQ